MKALILGAVAAIAALAAPPAQAGTVFDKVKAQQIVRCGVGGSIAGFSTADSKGEWQGIDVDYCRALAAAVLGDPKKVSFVALSLQQRFTALQSGEVDVLARDSFQSYSRDVSLGIVFVGVNFYTGAGFIVRKESGITSAKQLDGATICISQGNAQLGDLADFMRTNGLKYQLVQPERFADTFQAFLSGRCDAAVAGAADLAAAKAVQTPDPSKYQVLEQLLSSDPYSIAIARGDWEWFSIARWTLNGLVAAEQLGITRANVRELAGSAKDPAIRRFLGADEDLGGMIGLKKDWMANAIAAVGNYGEIYDRHFGPDTAINLPRGQNKLFSQGGLLYSPAFR